jgi:hypothetical protein
MKTLSITNDSGILALVNNERYSSYVIEQWTFPQLKNHFIKEMRNDSIIIWSIESEGPCTIAFLNKPSGEKKIREFSKVITVTNSRLYLTNYEDLTMAAQYADEKIPANYNSDLFIELNNGMYYFTIGQLNQQSNYEKVNLEIVIQPIFEKINESINSIFWFTS